MALFSAYAPPGTYTSVIIESNSAPTVGTARVPVIIGEGQEYFNVNNAELFRGSSAVQDDQAVNENISNQVVGLINTFNTTYFPVVDGTGKGVVTNDPSKVQVTTIDSDGNSAPVTVISLNGATGAFNTQEIIPPGTELLVSYFFKRGDTFVGTGGTTPYNIPENLLPQVPSFASLTVSPSGGNAVTLSLTTPGATGNLVTLQFVSGNAAADAIAVSGAGSDAITINIVKPTGTRTLQDLVNLINAGIPTLDGGYLTAGNITGAASTALVATAAVPFAGGAGGNSNTVFKVAHTPIVDGTDGGVVTTDPTKVTVQVNGTAVSVAAVDGQSGLVTLSQPVADTVTSLTIQYYFNTWQNTFDLLPASNVQSVVSVGLGPGRADFVQGIDYVLGVDADGNGTINWGASVTSSIGVSAAGDTAAFTPAEVLTALVDEHVFLQPLSGAVNGKNTVFSVPDVPTDGSGLCIATDDPSLISVYVGSDPLEAFLAGPVKVSTLSGESQLVTLYNPPIAGSNSSSQPLEPVGVWGSYYRNTLADHQYTITVVAPGYGGTGTFIITDELNRVAPLVQFVSGTVAASAGFAATGVVYPFSHPDLQAQAGAAVDETVTLTFNDDGNSVVTAAVQASLTLSFNSGAGHLTFTAGIPGAAGNNVQIAVDGSSQNAVPVQVTGDIITIYANWTGTPLTLAQIAALFPSGETLSGGQISCVAGGTTTGQAATTAATSLVSGANAVTTPVTHSYTVSSSNPTKGSGSGTTTVGYLNQTYEDAVTGFRVTILNASGDSSLTTYGSPTIPSHYAFAPADTLIFSVKVDSTGSNAAIRHCGSPGVVPAEANTLVAIHGLDTQVISNFGSSAGDTVLLNTFNKSGDNPNIGEFYYVNFTIGKTAADYAIHMYSNAADAYAAYGQPTAVNRVSLGVQLMSQNGVQLFGVVQVPKQPGMNTGSDNDYISAISTLTTALPGSVNKANVIVPLSTSPTVHQFLSRQLTTQANVRYKGEAIGFVGYDQFSTPAVMRANARGLQNARVIAVGNPSAGILITSPSTGVSVEYPLSGEFMAAAMAGLNCNPVNDVATSLTFQQLVGFSRLFVKYDDNTMDLMAADGLTLLLDNNGALKIRHYKSTDPSNPITSEPTCTTITDYVAQSFRSDLNQFIGRKQVSSLVTDVTAVCTARLKSLINQQIIAGYQNLSVVPDPSDPTQLDVALTFQPLFSLLYISVTFTVTTTLS